MMAVYSKTSVKYPNNCVHKMHIFWFWRKLEYAPTTLVYELQEDYIVYSILTFVMQKKGEIYSVEEN